MSHETVLGLDLLPAPGSDIPAGGGARTSQAWLVVGIAGILVAIAAVVVIVLVLTKDKDGGPVVQEVTATPTQGAVVVTATASPRPVEEISSPEPNLPPTYTPTPTYTPYPTATPTETATEAPPPTYTPTPTQKPQPPQPPTQTPTVPTPTAGSQPPYSAAVNKTDFGPWGRPGGAGGCKGPFNNDDPVKRFTVELAVTNHSNQTIPDGWHPVFHSAQGAVPVTCAWDEGYDTAIQPEETTLVTFYTHVESSDWVQRLVLDELGYEVTICFNSVKQVVACP